jgi:transposase
LIEGPGCELLLFLPPYSPDLDPAEEAFSKIKARLWCERELLIPSRHRRPLPGGAVPGGS